ncbi:uncharacterized protein LOC143742385 [Siphateles boraxobius]|uniref:uncharacterized protein LOC143742385 n=1 Tax=Siphateles boraxobius TaxID=180520 RepID=UPI0040641B71
MGQEEYTAIADAAQSLISLISRRQQQPEGSGQGGRGQPLRNTNTPSTSVGTSQLPTIQNEMQRSFPGYFRREMIRSKKRPAALSKISPAIAIKYVRLQFLVLSSPTERTPKPSEEIKLLEAGLGKRTMAVADNSCHEEIVCQLEEQYPKLKQLSGGWLCYKSTGGQGQRKLSVVATQSEGYTGRLLKTVTNNGKLILYIVPLQEELDASPLPHNAPEFSKMPKSSCKNCGVVMPLQFLALHIKSCNAEISSDEPEIVSTDEKEVNTTEVCPICEKLFPREDIAYHASFCGDGFPADTLMPLLEDDAREGTSSTIDLLPHGSRTTEQSTSPTAIVNDMAGPSTILADPIVPDLHL